MRLRICRDDELVEGLDRRAGNRRSAFIGKVIRRGLGDEQVEDDREAPSASRLRGAPSVKAARSWQQRRWGVRAQLATDNPGDFPMAKLIVEDWETGI